MRPFVWLPMSFSLPLWLSHFLCSQFILPTLLHKRSPERTPDESKEEWKEHIYILAMFLDIRGASRCKYESDSSHNERIETHYEISGSDQ